MSRDVIWSIVGVLAIIALLFYIVPKIQQEDRQAACLRRRLLGSCDPQMAVKALSA